MIKWELIFSVVAVVCSVIALFQTLYQITLSNKQALFDKRMKLFLEINSMIRLYGDNRILLINSLEKSQLWANGIFGWLTNSSYLENCSQVIQEPLKEPWHGNFLKKREQLREYAIEIKMIYSGKWIDVVSSFVLLYEQLLFKIYQYKIATERKETDDSITLEWRLAMCKDAIKATGLHEHIEQLEECYNEIISKKIMERMKNKTRLTR